jgi:Ca2+-binding EF-hand superfamily protein
MMGYGPGYGPGYGMGPGMMMGYGPGYGPGPGMGRYRMHRFATVDTDSNGIISADEAAARVEEAFSLMDLDANGALTLVEFMSVHMGFGPAYGPYAEERQKQKEARFREMDPGKTGSVSKEAFLKYGQKQFAAADTDKDGKVTPWEFRARAHMWSF